MDENTGIEGYYSKRREDITDKIRDVCFYLNESRKLTENGKRIADILMAGGKKWKGSVSISGRKVQRTVSGTDEVQSSTF